MKIIIRNGKVWTGIKSDRVSIKTIVIFNNTIESVLESALEPRSKPGDRDIDARGKFILPGLINLHTHLTLDGNSHDPLGTSQRDGSYIMLIKGARAAKKCLESGITTVRDVGAADGLDMALKRAITEGLIPGPRMLVSGRPLCMTGGHFRPISLEVDGADSARQAARLQLKNGADLIKVMATGGVVSPRPTSGPSAITIGLPQLTVEEMKAAAEEANKAGATIAAHAHSTQGIRNAVLAGVTTIEHSSFLDEDTARLVLEKGIFLITTLSTGQLMSGEEGLKAGIPEAVREAAGVAASNGLKSFRLAHRLGIKIGLGTDSGMPLNPHGSIVREARQLIQAGLTNEEVLVAATRTAAQAIGWGEKIGTIENGKLADLIVLNENPLEELGSLDDVAWVIKEGQIAFQHH